MKISELTPGIYKIRERNRRYSFRGESSSGYPVHLLRVEGAGARCRFYIDQDTQGQHPAKMDFARSYQIISRYTVAPDIDRAQLIISFSDEQGDQFNFVVNDAWRLRTVFESLPWLKI
jgi:hypothetical protein